jgi:hypothetical protein
MAGRVAKQRQQQPVSVSYLINQAAAAADANAGDRLAQPACRTRPGKVIGDWDYDHPIFDQAAIGAQAQLDAIQGVERLWFCGAWGGYGFHEDGLNSALAVANASAAARPGRLRRQGSKARHETRTLHRHGDARALCRRAEPGRARFVYPLFFLALPLSQLQDAGNRLVRHRARAALSRCVSATTARATARRRSRGSAACWPPKASPRPTAKWCCRPFRASSASSSIPSASGSAMTANGALRAVLAEVRNTFGDHHNYLVAHADQRPITAADTLTARKIFHVSPFFPVAGEYRFRFDLSAARRRVVLDYWLDGERVLATSLQGVPQPSPPPPRAARCCASRC